MNKLGNALIVLIFGAVCVVALYAKFGRDSKPTDPATATGVAGEKAAAPENKVPTLEIVFASSDGKKEWVNDAIKGFNAEKHEIGGKVVVVKANHMRSGESRQAILAGKEKPTIWGPAGTSWVDLINKDWELREHKPFLTGVRDTVNTALVISLWEPMARALGWPGKAIGWADLRSVATNPKGWAAYGHPEWGAFRFGHSHPDYSNSAMLSVLSLIYAASGKTTGLTSADMKSEKVRAWVRDIEHAIVHYGESSSWLSEKLCARGPSYLSAVTLYESSVVKANDKCPQKPFPLVAVYPKEGTFWETHPAGIVQADWVTPDMAEAAKLFLDYLVAPAQQAKTASFGFRPAIPGIPLTAPFDEAHGVNPGAERKELAYVDEELFQRANEVWHETKKKATIWLLVDTSGSMNGDPMEAARRGAVKFLKQMEPDDVVQVLAFGTQTYALAEPGPMRVVGEGLVGKVSSLYAMGNTRLNDTVLQALAEIDQARAAGNGDRLYGIVLLSDGKDTSSQHSKADIVEKLPKMEDSDGTRIFSIAYGPEADVDFLTELSERSNGVMLKGSSADVEKLYHQLAAYF